MNDHPSHCKYCNKELIVTKISDFQKGFYYFECPDKCKPYLTTSQVPFWIQECKDVCNPKNCIIQDSIGRDMYRQYCTTCGKHSTSSMKKNDDAVNTMHLKDAYDKAMQDIREKFSKRDEHNKMIVHVKQSLKNNEWWKAYNNYLNSAQWKMKRRYVLERDGYKCQACLNRRADQAHHLTYRNVGNEPLFDLIAVCTPCHDKIHELKDIEHDERNKEFIDKWKKTQ